MFKFSRRSAPTPGREFEPSAMHSAANSSQAAGDVQRELVRVAFRDTLRATGVPAQWLGCEVHYIQDPRRGEHVQVLLVMKKWSGHLLRYSLAFQQALAHCLDRYEPHVDHSKYEWVWKYSAECASALRMPAPAEWAKKLAPQDAKPSVAMARAPVAATGIAQPDKAFELRDIFSNLTADQLK